MGWWEQHDGTVIGDELADMVGDAIEGMVRKLVERFPTITREQVLHTMAFCSGYLKQFDEDGKLKQSDKILQVMTIGQSQKWADKHRAEPDESKLVAPGTDLMNVRNPFTQEVA